MNKGKRILRLFLLSMSGILLSTITLCSQNWMAIDRLLSSDWEQGDNIGISIAIDGDYMLTGAWWEDNVPFVNSAGAAYLFKKDNMDNWSEVIKWESPNAEVLGYFGFSVAIEGDLAVIGAYNEDEDIGGGMFYVNAGAVYIYERQPNDSWTMEHRLVASDPDDGDLFGYDLALSGDYLIVGAWSEDENANGTDSLENAGSAYIFERQQDGTWDQVEKIVGSDRAAGDNFGRYVDISGDYALVGAMNKDYDPDFHFSAGAAYVYERNSSTGAWEEAQKLLASDHGNFDNFGWDVAIDGDKAFVGARAEADIPGGGTASNTGTAYYFLRNSSGTWVETQKIYASDHAQNDFFGGAIDLDGNIAVIGAELEDHDESGGDFVSGAGSAYIYERQPNGIWQEVQKVIGEGREIDDLFGASVAVKDDQIAIGAWRADEPDGQDLLFDVGAAYIFKRNTPLSVDAQRLSHQVSLSPNPSNGLLQISSVAGNPMDLQLSIYDLFGNRIFEESMELMSYWEQDFQNLPGGMYLVSLKGENDSEQVFKWIKI